MEKREITDEDTEVERGSTTGLWLHFKDNMDNFKASIFLMLAFLLLLLLYNNTFSYQADLLRVSATSTSPPAHLDISSTLWHPSLPELLYYP